MEDKIRSHLSGNIKGLIFFKQKITASMDTQIKVGDLKACRQVKLANHAPHA